MAKDPIIFKELLLLLEEAFKPGEVIMISYVETEGHRRINLCIMDFLGIALMEGCMIFLNGIEVIVHAFFCVVGVQKDEVVFLHPYEVICLLRPSAHYPTIQLLHKEGFDRAKVLCADFFQTESGRNEHEYAIAPVSL